MLGIDSTCTEVNVASAEMSVSFNYASSKKHEVRAETRLKALQAAKNKAQDMAEVVDAKLGKALVINEHPQGGLSGGFGSNGFVSNREMANFSISSFADLASDKFIPGAITVKMTVYVTFELR